MTKISSFSTTTITNDNRISALEHNLKNILPDMEIKPPYKQELRAEIHSIHLHSMTLASLHFSPISLMRNPCHLLDRNDGFSIVCCQAGTYDVIQPFGDGVQVFPGMASLAPTSLHDKCPSRQWLHNSCAAP